MTNVVIISGDGGNIVSLEPLTLDEAESLAMYVAISDSRTWQECVMDVSNWQTRFRNTPARELPGLLAINIKRKHNGKVPEIDRQGASHTVVRTDGGTRVAVSQPNSKAATAFAEWDLIVRTGRKR